MEKIILHSKSEEELREKIKNNISLAEDETIEIKEIKKPFKFLFFSKEGEYEIKIVKKCEIKKEVNVEIKKEKVKKEKKEVKVEKKKNIENSKDILEDKLRIVLKEFIALTNLNVVIKDIKVSKQNKNKTYLIDLDGEDTRHFIGEKGVALSSFEYLLMSIPEFKDIRILIDSNNYKDKREQTLRDLANRMAKSVLKTGKKVKLNPMNSRERKIIHEEISKINELETVSVGIEPKRCLVIKLKNDK